MDFWVTFSEVVNHRQATHPRRLEPLPLGRTTFPTAMTYPRKLLVDIGLYDFGKSNFLSDIFKSRLVRVLALNLPATEDEVCSFHYHIHFTARLIASKPPLNEL